MVSARAERPVLGAEELLLDQVADHVGPRPAEQLRGHEVADRGQEHEHGAGQHALERRRPGDVEERAASSMP